ncbi:hypothetical protein SAMN05444000_12361 [Shimia gijangensis]|uniref:Uncharacterized protein n=1 Tax=Shimia gijangensis TaxID=1470563 RepID=A0A1M6QYP7_9RHOB|nr:hypothetical protein [Shimia gijangensis]SHK25283.1 hypothetical protein SAMN05444000_12361 [Shimia gijangensis]
MRPLPQVMANSNAATRHNRLFELIRQGNLTQQRPAEFLQKTRVLSAQEKFRAMACNSLRRAS